MDLEEFLKASQHDPVEFLSMEPLMAYQKQKDRWLEPGQLIHVYPPFCFQEAEKGVSMRALPALEVIGFHADLAAKIADVPDGGKVQYSFEPEEQDQEEGAGDEKEGEGV